MISILLPTYNDASVLRQSINSMLNQTYKDYELLILDDGSADNTLEIVSSFYDSRIRYIKLAHRGITETLNSGLQQARYNIIVRMDAGDLSLPDRLEKQLEHYVKLPQNTIVSCRYAVFDKKIRYTVPVSTKSDAIKKRLALHADFAHSSVMYNKEFILSFGGYKNVPLEDYDLWLRTKNSAEFYIVDKILLLIEYTSGRLSTNNILQNYENHYALQENYYKDLDTEFGILKIKEKIAFRGWREYFYGDKKRARHYWKKLALFILISPRIIAALLFTYLPDTVFLFLKEFRIKFRLLYFYNYFSQENIYLRKQYAVLIRSI
ncbi:MAG: glycosyltransferase [Bacteroidota bacterium]|nr:glycosyltransferase [Bacteroidota bacterium]